jgi:hypothetical protein
MINTASYHSLVGLQVGFLSSKCCCSLTRFILNHESTLPIEIQRVDTNVGQIDFISTWRFGWTQMAGYCCQLGQEFVAAKPVECFLDNQVTLMGTTPDSEDWCVAFPF